MSAQLQDSIGFDDNEDDFMVPHGTPDADGVVAEAIQHGNRKMVRYTAQCPECTWASHNYAKRETALLIMNEHRENSCLTGSKRSKTRPTGATPFMQAATLFRTGTMHRGASA